MAGGRALKSVAVGAALLGAIMYSTQKSQKQIENVQSRSRAQQEHYSKLGGAEFKDDADGGASPTKS
jgi:hypothetical protein